MFKEKIVFLQISERKHLYLQMKILALFEYVHKIFNLDFVFIIGGAVGVGLDCGQLQFCLGKPL